MSSLPADLGRLLETKQGADVDFEVCGKVFAAHKLVLAARSSVFIEDFFGPAKEKATGSSHIRICDMHPDAFEALHYPVHRLAAGDGDEREGRGRRDSPGSDRGG